MIRKFVRTITVEVEYVEPYGPSDNAWDAMHEYTPVEMCEAIRKDETLATFFANTDYTLIDDEVKFTGESAGPWCGDCNQPLDTGNHEH